MFHPMMLLRVVFSGALVWFLLAVLWMGLPNPSFEQAGDSNAYATTVLKSGKTLTRVYDVDDYFIASRGLNRQSFALEYTLDITSKVLHIGDATVKVGRSRDTDKSETICALVKTGDQDGINPPWFSHADSTLLFWWIHRDTATMLLQVHSSADGIISVVPVGSSKKNLGDGVVPMSAVPLLRLENIGPNSHDQLKVVLPSFPQSSSPSRTYRVRLAILTVIAPVGLLVYTIFCALSPAADALLEITWFLVELVFFYGCFVALCWIAKGRPPISEFLATQPIMRVVHRHVGGMPGPTSNGDASLEAEDEGHFESRRPIRSVSDFFRSSAPLDDILASFDSTRGLTQPMSFGRGATEGNAVIATPGFHAPEEPSTGKPDLSEAEALGDLEAGLADPEKSME